MLKCEITVVASLQVDLSTLPVTPSPLGGRRTSTMERAKRGNVECTIAKQPKRQRNGMPKTEKEGVVDECAFEETINRLGATRADLFSFLLTEEPSQ